ncbi:retrovirus-related Pol polyprotein from transposon 412 [Trichonephila clavipes]|nr:retrovirus-related Pol polyprotein from transposon 412 [Trichonephila clavipes]
MRSFMNRVESLMSQKADGKKTLKCWTCGREGHLQRSCRARQGAETNSASRKEVSEKLINDHLVGRRLPDFGKPHFPVCQISTKSTDIADPFILGLDFLKEHGFTLDFNKNELRSIHEEVTIFKIKHRTESIRQKSSAERLFQEFEDVFSRNSSDIGHTTVTQHIIDTADHPPIKQHPRRLPFAKQEEVGTLLREMQENDIIEPSSSPWASQSSWFKVFVRTPKSVRRKEWKRPENLRDLRSFLGLCTYYRKFVKGFSNIARPLHKLTESKQKFQWTKECEDSFLQLKEALTSSPILIYLQPDKPFILDTDASNESVGAVLSQEIDAHERVVAYWSQVARWIQRLNEYYFDIRHRKGSSHGNADALSRRPCPENCRHCSRVETKYDYAIR